MNKEEAMKVLGYQLNMKDTDVYTPINYEAIDTVLNELEKKEAEIDKLRNTNKDLLKKLRNRVKEVKKLTRYSLYKKEFTRLNKQLEKKDAVIDLMAEYIVDLIKYNNSEEIRDAEEVKQYFYKKASEE